MNAIAARLREPGTLRSAALALFALKALLPESWGVANLTADDFQNLLSLAILLLAGTSAAMPAQGAAVVEKAETVAQKAAEAAAVAASAARKAEAAVSEARL